MEPGEAVQPAGRFLQKRRHAAAEAPRGTHALGAGQGKHRGAGPPPSGLLPDAVTTSNTGSFNNKLHHCLSVEAYFRGVYILAESTKDENK